MTPALVPVYASFRAPLAMLELPLFMVTPDLYGTTFGLSLAAVGLVLLSVRAIDAIIDPMLGRYMAQGQSNKTLLRNLLLGSPFLALGFFTLITPQVLTQAPSLTWLAASSIVCYLAYSWVSIAYQALGSSLSTTSSMANRISTFREVAGLVGVLLALGFVATKLYLLAVATLAGLLLVTGLSLVKFFPSQDTSTPDSQHKPIPLSQVLSTPGFRALLAVFMVNGVASAITATLLQFFVRDYLGSEAHFASYLLCFFVAGLLGLPCWLALANRLGQLQALLLAMIVTVAVFSLVAFIEPSSKASGPPISGLFILICIGTGFTLAADLMLPSAALARLINANGFRGSQDASFFGVWSLATKLNLALAAGLALPLLSYMGYQPTAQSSSNPSALLWIYGVLPIALKLLACLYLWRKLPTLSQQLKARP